MPTITESTLPMAHYALAQNIGFRSPWRVRLRLFGLGLIGRVRALHYVSEDVEAWGWEDRFGTPYITRVVAARGRPAAR